MNLERQISMNQLKIWNRDKWSYVYVYGSGLFVDERCANGRCVRIIYTFCLFINLNFIF